MKQERPISDQLTPRELERNECILIALQVASEAQTEQGRNAALEIVRRIRERKGS